MCGSKDNTIRVHLGRVTRYPKNFPAGYYWYGDRRDGPGRPRKISILGDVSGDFVEDGDPQAATPDPEAESELSEKEASDKEDVGVDMDDHSTVSSGLATRTRSRTVNPPDYFGRCKAPVRFA